MHATMDAATLWAAVRTSQPLWRVAALEALIIACVADGDMQALRALATATGLTSEELLCHLLRRAARATEPAPALAKTTPQERLPAGWPQRQARVTNRRAREQQPSLTLPPQRRRHVMTRKGGGRAVRKVPPHPRPVLVPHLDVCVCFAHCWLQMFHVPEPFNASSMDSQPTARRHGCNMSHMPRPYCRSLR